MGEELKLPELRLQLELKTPTARVARYNGERIRSATDSIASMLVATGKTIDQYDKAVIAAALIAVLYPAQPVDVPSWD